jgi:hypothetical protein
MRTKSTCLSCYCTRVICKGGGPHSEGAETADIKIREAYFERLLSAQVIPIGNSPRFDPIFNALTILTDNSVLMCPPYPEDKLREVKLKHDKYLEGVMARVAARSKEAHAEDLRQGRMPARGSGMTSGDPSRSRKPGTDGTRQNACLAVY